MERQIKLIWDFRGQNALKIAQHHEIHLKEYITDKKLPSNDTGVQSIHDMYAIAFMIVTDTYLTIIRDTLKPHRAEIYPINFSGN